MKRLLLAVVAVLVLAAVAAGAWLFLSLERPYRGYTEPEQFVEIPQGSGSAAMGRRLEDAGVVRSALAFRLAVWMRGVGHRLQAGEYRFDEPLSATAVVERIARGDVYLLTITFREGLTIRQMSEVFESRGFGPAAEFVKAAGNASLIEDVDPAAPNLEGYLFPDTYSLPRRATASQLVERMVAGFSKAFTPDIAEAAEARGFSVRELVTLASLIEKETAKPEERELVAAVYSNRLRIGMGMQADPTIIYALELLGQYDGNLTRQNMRVDHPYNTYRYAGLPPGPIAAPGRASLQAAVNPADVPYLFFVSRNDGSHIFSTTYDEHRRHVQEWQVRFFQERRNREGH
ncbi:endolytic transglycosylase MltG [soil metagenome]